MALFLIELGQLLPLAENVNFVHAGISSIGTKNCSNTVDLVIG